ncbi:MAG: S8 family serine peptidase [Trueperaceae bacterium]
MTRIPFFVMALVATAALLLACGTPPGPIDEQPGPVSAPSSPIQLSSGDARASFELENISGNTLDWTIETSNGSDNPEAGQWFTIEPQEGTLEPFGKQPVTLTQMSGLEPGRYTSVLRVIYRGGVTAFDVIGEVSQDSSADGDGSISGYLRTDNAEIPITAASFFGRNSTVDADNLRTPQERPAFVPGQLIVALEPTAHQLSLQEGEEPGEALAGRHNLTLLNDDPSAETVLIATTDEVAAVAAELEADPAVRYAEPNYLFYPHALPNDPLLMDLWQLPVVGAPVAWDAPALSGGSGSRPVVAVIDSGIDLDHEDLRGIFVSDGYDFCGSTDCRSRDGNPRPDSNFDTHGTHVTGLLAAIADNGRGIAGVAGSDARVLPIKVFNDGITTAAALADAIRWAAGLDVSGVPRNPEPADIITLSLGSEGDSSTVREAVQDAQEAGALVIASAGNQGHGDVDYPARYSGVIGVGAVNTDFERSCFSDYGQGLDLMAPGGDGYLDFIDDCRSADDEAILSTFPGNDYGIDAGTSMAAPLAAGAAVQAWTSMSSPSAESVRERLLETAYFDDEYMSEERYGAGIVRVDRAVGFPGPGDEAAVQATGPSTALDTVTLQLDGTSTRFSLDGLAGGSYTLAADAAGLSLTLSGSRIVQLNESEDISSLVLPLMR